MVREQYESRGSLRHVHAKSDIIRIWEKKGIKYQMISRHTVDKYFTAIRTVLNWAEGRIIDTSPARDLKPDAAPREAAARKRLPFSSEDHRIIFGSTVYRGCKSAKYRYLGYKPITARDPETKADVTLYLRSHKAIVAKRKREHEKRREDEAKMADSPFAALMALKQQQQTLPKKR